MQGGRRTGRERRYGEGVARGGNDGVGRTSRGEGAVRGEGGQGGVPVARSGREAVLGTGGEREAGDGRAGRERRRGEGKTTTIKN